VADSDDVVSLLRELRDAASRHQQYIEERDRKNNERMDRSHRSGYAMIAIGLVLAVYLVSSFIVARLQHWSG
jgi:hypothetical protein